jgi:hypothetical protein
MRLIICDNIANMGVSYLAWAINIAHGHFEFDFEGEGVGPTTKGLL